MSRRRRARPSGRVIWIAKDQSGVFAYNHAPRIAKDECTECGSTINNFRGVPEQNCWELCDEVVKVLGIPTIKHGQVIRYVRATEE